MKLTQGPVLFAFGMMLTSTFSWAQADHHAPKPKTQAHAHPAMTPKPSPAPVVSPTPASVTPVTSPAPMVPVVPAFIDPHPYQSQTMVRYRDDSGNLGVIETISGPTLRAYKIWTPGVDDPTLYPNTIVLSDQSNPLPEMEFMGGNYGFFKGNLLVTVGADGIFYYIGKQNYEVDVHGGVYFTKRGTNELVLVDSYGTFYNTGMIAPKIRLAGGNFFIDENGVLTTFKSMGAKPFDYTGMMAVKTGTNFSKVNRIGGNFFINEDDSVTTISAVNGFYSEKAYIPDSKPMTMGGNYFISEDQSLFTITEDGRLMKNAKLPSTPTIYGYSYLKFADGSMVVIDGKGIPHSSFVRITEDGTHSEPVTIIKDRPELNSLFIPNKK